MRGVVNVVNIFKVQPGVYVHVGPELVKTFLTDYLLCVYLLCSKLIFKNRSTQARLCHFYIRHIIKDERHQT